MLLNKRHPSTRRTSKLSRVVTLQQCSPVVRPASKHQPTPKTHHLASERARDKLKDASSVGVYLRLRPLKVDEPTIVKLDEQQVRTIPPDGSTQQVYSFTQVFDNAPQSTVFDQAARPVVEDFIVSAKDGLIFTYGITSSGKTYTMEGLKKDPGLIYRTIDFLFNSIGSQQTQKALIESDGQNSYRLREQDLLYPNLGRAETPSTLPSVIKWQNRAKETSSVPVDPSTYFCLFISLVELYNRQVHDLFEEFDTSPLEKKKREIRSDQRGMSYVANVVEIEVKSADEAVEYYTRGVRRRKTGSTALNQESSRGHCVLNLRLVRVRKTHTDRFDPDTLLASQLCLVDLAGSERAKRSGATGGALHEACNINNSLGALRKCIRALRDREPTTNIQYREYSLTRLFKSYFEGHGSVRMVLCVKPTSDDFFENNIAMEFGLLTQDVAVDYASPPKMIKRSKSQAQDPNQALMYEYLDRKLSHFESNPELSDEEFISDWIGKLKSNRDRRQKYVETALCSQKEVRANILKTADAVTTLKRHCEMAEHDVRQRDEQLEFIENKLDSTRKSREGLVERSKLLERQVKQLKAEKEQARLVAQKHKIQKDHSEEVLRKMKDLVDTIQNEKIKELFEKWTPATPTARPSAPVQSSSPVDIPNPSTPETTDSRSAPTMTNSSSDAIEFQGQRSPVKLILSPNSGVPIVNPKHNRSLSCSSMQWIHHKPKGTIDTGTVLKPNAKNGRYVKNLRSSDILRKDAAGYSVVHQDADTNGDVETSIYKGQIISTTCGGAQVLFNDIETMRQVSPKRRRAASDAQNTQ